MRLGIIGLPQAGKTTLFNALTRGDRPVTSGGVRFAVHTADVNVPDVRVDRLAGLFDPQKTSYARVTYLDIAGLDGSAKESFSGALLNQLSQVNAFVLVVRCFDDPAVPHPFGEVDAQRDLETVAGEFLLNDQLAVERKLERLTEDKHRGSGREKAQLEREAALFERLQTALEAGEPLRDLDLTPDELKTLSGYGFLTLKPVLVALNLAEGQTPPQVSFPHRLSQVIALQGQLEMELAQLPPEEAQEYLHEYDIQEPGLDRVIRLSYDLLGLISFFTVGPDEVRAWTARQGATAQEAAGVIHSDLQKGFIRAEVIAWDELLSLGGLAAARSAGKLRLEGKDYLVRDGEIVHVRFNV